MGAWLLPVGAVGLLALLGVAWWAFRRPAAAPARRARRTNTLPAAPAGARDVDRVAWVVGKLTRVAPRKVDLAAPLRTALGRTSPATFLAAAGREFRLELTLPADGLGLTVAQFAAYVAHVRRGRRPPPTGGRKRAPRTTGDVLDRLEPAALALATELGLRRDWELEPARRHLTKEYLRWNARIHLATREEDRTAVQARLEQIGRLREALTPARR
jgi:hypothetical protein